MGSIMFISIISKYRSLPKDNKRRNKMDTIVKYYKLEPSDPKSITALERLVQIYVMGGQIDENEEISRYVHGLITSEEIRDGTDGPRRFRPRFDFEVLYNNKVMAPKEAEIWSKKQEEKVAYVEYVVSGGIENVEDLERYFIEKPFHVLNSNEVRQVRMTLHTGKNSNKICPLSRLK